MGPQFTVEMGPFWKDGPPSGPYFTGQMGPLLCMSLNIYSFSPSSNLDVSLAFCIKLIIIEKNYDVKLQCYMYIIGLGLHEGS